MLNGFPLCLSLYLESSNSKTHPLLYGTWLGELKTKGTRGSLTMGMENSSVVVRAVGSV